MSHFLAQVGGVAWSVLFTNLIVYTLTFGVVEESFGDYVSAGGARTVILVVGLGMVFALGVYLAFAITLSSLVRAGIFPRNLHLIAYVILIALNLTIFLFVISLGLMFEQMTIHLAVFAGVLLTSWTALVHILARSGSL